MMRWFLLLVLSLSGPWQSLARGAAEDAKPPAGVEKISYFHQVRPILQAHCQGCHQPAKARGEYVITAFD